jgi:hypothetical protein
VYPLIVYGALPDGEIRRLASDDECIHEISCTCGACALGLMGLVFACTQLAELGGCYYVLPL